MPPKIITNTRAAVDDGFINLLKGVWRTRYAKIIEELDAVPLVVRKRAEKDKAPIKRRLAQLCTNPVALDKEITRLRALNYIRFGFKQYQGDTYLVGLTKPIVLEGDPSLTQPRFYVYVPVTIMASKPQRSGFPADYHFIPEGFELIEQRHPHHVAERRWRNAAYEEVHIDHPTCGLDLHAKTCWGDFAGIVSSCLADGDIVDLFRNIQIYLTRHNPSSPLHRGINGSWAFQKNGKELYENSLG